MKRPGNAKHTERHEPQHHRVPGSVRRRRRGACVRDPTRQIYDVHGEPLNGLDELPTDIRSLREERAHGFCDDQRSGVSVMRLSLAAQVHGSGPQSGPCLTLRLRGGDAVCFVFERERVRVTALLGIRL